MSLGVLKVDMTDLQLWKQILFGKWNNRAPSPSALVDLVTAMRTFGVHNLSKETRLEFLIHPDQLDGVTPIRNVDFNTITMEELPVLKLKAGVVIYAAGGTHRKISIMRYLDELTNTKHSIERFLEVNEAKKRKTAKVKHQITEGKATLKRLEARYEEAKYMAVEVYDYGEHPFSTYSF